MADRGYVDYYDALRIYVPATTQQAKNAHASISDDQPVVVHWIAPLSHGASRLENALAAIDQESLDGVQSSLAMAMNMALSADRVELWDEEHQERIIQRFQAGLLLGLEALNGPSAPPKSDAETLEKSPCSLIFRIGYGRMLNAGEPARRTSTINRLRGQSGRVDGVDIPNLREWAEWLTARHPSLPGGRSPASATELIKMNEKARILADLARVAGSERPDDDRLGAIHSDALRLCLSWTG